LNLKSLPFGGDFLFMKIFYVILIALLFGNCSNNNQEQVAQLSKQLDSTRVLIDSLIKMQTKEESEILAEPQAGMINSNKKEERERLVAEKGILQERKEIPVRKVEKPTPLPIQAASEPKEYYYKGSKQLSLQIIGEERRSKDFILFDPWGKETYRFEQRIESYSITVDLVEWHPNGALSKAVVHTNPGASMYWYTAEYSFGINNEPLWMVSTQHPERTVALETDNTFYWDPKTKSWKKQEVSKEQPVHQD